MTYEPGTFFIVPNAPQLEKVDSLAQVIYIWMCKFSYGKSTAFPSLAKLCEVSGIKSRKTVISRIQILEDLGFIEKSKTRTGGGQWKHNEYKMMLFDQSGSSGNTQGTTCLENPVPCVGHTSPCVRGEPALVADVHTKNIDIYNNISYAQKISGNSYGEELSTQLNILNGNGPLTNTIAIGQQSETQNAANSAISDGKKELARNVNAVMTMFNKINKSVGYAHKGHRKNAENLLKEYSLEDIEDMVKTVERTNEMEFAPIILTPSDLFYKLEKLKLFLKKK